MLAKIIGILVVALGLGGVAAYYATSDGHTCPLSGACKVTCPSDSDSCTETPCPTETACPSTSADTGCCPLSRAAAVAATPEFVGPPAPSAEPTK